MSLEGSYRVLVTFLKIFFDNLSWVAFGRKGRNKQQKLRKPRRKGKRVHGSSGIYKSSKVKVRSICEFTLVVLEDVLNTTICIFALLYLTCWSVCMQRWGIWICFSQSQESVRNEGIETKFLLQLPLNFLVVVQLNYFNSGGEAELHFGRQRFDVGQDTNTWTFSTAIFLL